MKTKFNIDRCLILAAGYGKRMGKIGEILPKVLWPIFEKTLLEIEILYVSKIFGINDIYINVHYGQEQIINFIDSKLKDKLIKEQIKLQVIPEKELLDIGGAIHNIASLPEINYQGNLLIINSDQFLFFDFDKNISILNNLNSFAAILYGIKVDISLGYNQLNLNQNNQLIHITKHSDLIKTNSNTLNYLTYAGISVINLPKLTPIAGPSNFFESVANYYKNPVLVHSINDYDYFDFGTFNRYYLSLFDLMHRYLSYLASNSNSTEISYLFLKFCLTYNIFLENKFKQNLFSYGHTHQSDSIILDNFKIQQITKKHSADLAIGKLCHNNIIEYIYEINNL